MIITTTNAVEGRRVAEYIGVVHGCAVMGSNLFRDFFAGIRDVVGASASGDPIVLRAADLVNGRQSWRAAIDADELERRERAERGGSYYGGE